MSRNTITASRDDVFIHKKVEHFWKHENYMSDQDTAMSKWYFLLEGTSSQNADGRWKIRSSYVVERKMQRASKRLSISRTKVEAIADNIPKWEECYWCPPRFRNHRTIFVVDVESMLHHAEVQNLVTAVFLDERNNLKCKIRYIPDNSSNIRNNWTTMLWKLRSKIRCKDQL